MAHDVFISYSSKDKVIADALTANLEKNGIRCWIAPRDILPGQNWGESIIGAIHGSKLLVLVLSSNSNKSSQIVRELERAVDTGIPIIPFRVEEILPSDSISYFIASAHWLDALTPPLEEHIDNLIKTIRTLLEMPVQPVEREKELKPLQQEYQSIEHKNQPIESKPLKQSPYWSVMRILALIFGLIYLVIVLATGMNIEYYFVRELYNMGILFTVGVLFQFIIGIALIFLSIKPPTAKNRLTGMTIALIIVGLLIWIYLSSFPHVVYWNIFG